MSQQQVCVFCGDRALCIMARLGHKRVAGIVPARPCCATCAEAITAAWARAEGWQKAKKELDQ